MSPSVRVRRLAATVLLSGLAWSGAAFAQQAATPAPEPAQQTWTVNCSGAAGQNELACTLTQVLVVKDSGQRVLTAVVAKRDGKYLLNLGLPHGLNLPKGVDVWVDEGPRVNHPIVTADQKGSYATVTLDDKLVAVLKKGTTLNVAVTAFAGNEIILQLSLNGFTAGFAKL
jgi:invasion protein IalB